MNGLQFINMLKARADGTDLEIDEVKKTEVMARMKQEYPYGVIAFESNDGEITCRTKGFPENPECMRCGKPMIDRVNQYRKNEEWIHKARDDHRSNWECSTCAPDGHMVLMEMQCVAKEAIE